jgi:hypothetical protein
MIEELRLVSTAVPVNIVKSGGGRVVAVWKQDVVHSVTQNLLQARLKCRVKTMCSWLPLK